MLSILSTSLFIHPCGIWYWDNPDLACLQSSKIITAESVNSKTINQINYLRSLHRETDILSLNDELSSEAEVYVTSVAYNYSNNFEVVQPRIGDAVYFNFSVVEGERLMTEFDVVSVINSSLYEFYDQWKMFGWYEVNGFDNVKFHKKNYAPNF